MKWNTDIALQFSYPPAQTVCDAADTVTYFYQGPTHTDYEINYVTYYTWATVWVGYVFMSLITLTSFPLFLPSSSPHNSQ